MRCLGNGIIPVSIRLKNNVRTQRSDNIIQRAERSLLNERIREVNIILDWLKHDTYMYETKLSAILSQDHMKECKEFITDHKELRHKLVMECQTKKYLKLWHQKYQGGNSSIAQWLLNPGPGFQDQDQMLGCESVRLSFIHSPGNSSGTWP